MLWHFWLSARKDICAVKICHLSPKVLFRNSGGRQVSAVADEPVQRAASWQTCCKQRWTLMVINLQRTKLTLLATVDVFKL